MLFAALAMPVLTLLSPAIWFPVPLPSLQKQNAAVKVRMPQPAAAPFATRAAGSGSGVKVATHVDERAAPAQTGISTKYEPGVASSPARREVPWPVVAASAYLAIVLVLFVRFFIGIQFGKRLERAATPIEDAHALQILSEASRAAGLRAAPRLAESEMLSVPLMLGARGPVVLFPSQWRKWDEDELAAVLAHEVSHVERRDALIQRLALIHRAIFWFSPLAWRLERQLTELSERASDEAALAGGADRTRYAEALLGFFAELGAAPERVWWQGVSMAKAGQAEKRVERILAWRGAMSNKLTKSLVVALAVIAAPVVALTAPLHPSLGRRRSGAGESSGAAGSGFTGPTGPKPDPGPNATVGADGTDSAGGSSASHATQHAGLTDRDRAGSFGGASSGAGTRSRTGARLLGGVRKLLWASDGRLLLRLGTALRNRTEGLGFHGDVRLPRGCGAREVATQQNPR